VDREVCPLNLAPTASTAVAMAIGDALAAVWMQRPGITQADFAVNHPAGSLGRQLTLSVADLMVPINAWPPLQPDSALADVVEKLTGTLAGATWVCQPEQPSCLLGLITDGDLRRALRTHAPQGWAAIQAADLMTTDPITAAPDQLAAAALELMERNRRQPISVLPVQEASGELVGLLRLHDLVQAGLRRPVAKPAAGLAQAA